MSKVEVVCPFCKKSNPVEKYSFSGELGYDLLEIKCPTCSKSWGENVIEGGRLAKSAPVPSSELAELRVQLNAQFAELLSKLQGMTERRVAAPASFQHRREETATVLKFVAGMPGGSDA
jgi:hypothetical protein